MTRFLLCSLLLLSCGTTPSESSFCGDSARLECEASQECGGDLFGNPDLASCVSDTRENCTYLSDNCVLQPTADLCLNALESRKITCNPQGPNWTRSAVEQCSGVFSSCQFME